MWRWQWCRRRWYQMAKAVMSCLRAQPNRQGCVRVRALCGACTRLGSPLRPAVSFRGRPGDSLPLDLPVPLQLPKGPHHGPSGSCWGPEHCLTVLWQWAVELLLNTVKLRGGWWWWWWWWWWWRWWWWWCCCVCCPWAARPAVRCPAAGEGLRGRLRRSAGKLTPMIMFTEWCCRTGGNERSFGQTKGIFVDDSSGPTMLFWGFFFYWPESGFLVKNRRARVTNGCRRHFAC